MKLCIFCSLLQCVVLYPSQCLNLKALTRTLDETEVSPFQRVVGVETLDILHGIELERRLLQRIWRARPPWDPSPATAWVPSAVTAWVASLATVLGT